MKNFMMKFAVIVAVYFLVGRHFIMMIDSGAGRDIATVIAAVSMMIILDTVTGKYRQKATN